MSQRIHCSGGPVDDGHVVIDGTPPVLLAVAVGSVHDWVGPNKIAVVYPCPPVNAAWPVHIYAYCNKGHYHYQGVQ